MQSVLPLESFHTTISCHMLSEVLVTLMSPDGDESMKKNKNGDIIYLLDSRNHESLAHDTTLGRRAR